MSNTQKPNGKPFSLARYRAEAKGDPFELWLDDDTAISIARPTGDQVFDAEEAGRTGTSKDVLLALCGDQAQGFLSALGPEDAAVLEAVVKDMQKHFGMGEQ